MLYAASNCARLADKMPNVVGQGRDREARVYPRFFFARPPSSIVISVFFLPNYVQLIALHVGLAQHQKRYAASLHCMYAVHSRIACVSQYRIVLHYMYALSCMQALQRGTVANLSDTRH